jgi:hypothetical protein
MKRHGRTPAQVQAAIIRKRKTAAKRQKLAASGWWLRRKGYDQKTAAHWLGVNPRILKEAMDQYPP